MRLTKENVRKIFLKYLFAAFGAGIVGSVFGLVDMMVVGQYYGPIGTAALAVVAPLWNLFYSLGLLTGVGASVLYTALKEKSALLPPNEKKQDPNSFFTLALILNTIILAIVWILFIVFEDNILYTLGASNETITLAKEYLHPVLFCVPLFSFNNVIGAFLRNDHDPLLPMIGVLLGGVLNIVGDFLLVFVFKLGIVGASYATIACNSMIFLVNLIHFFKKSNTLKLAKPVNFFKNSWDSLSLGFSSFFIDVSMGIVTIFLNNTIMKYFNNDVLSIYGIIINVSTFVQCVTYGIGQGSQPLLSETYGANDELIVKKLLKYGLVTVLCVTLLALALNMIYPDLLVYIFMSPTETVLEIAPKIIRIYSLSYIFLPLNVYLVYFYQAILKKYLSLSICLLRGFLISCPLIVILPLIFNSEAIWFAMPLTEFIVAIVGVVFLYIYYKKGFISTQNKIISRAN